MMCRCNLTQPASGAATAAAIRARILFQCMLADEAKMIAKASGRNSQIPDRNLEQGGHQVAFQQGMTDP